LIAEQELAALILNLAKGESFEVETLATQAVTELRAEFNILKLHAVRERRLSKDRLPWRPKTADSWI
jgi:hypothetical protein